MIRKSNAWILAAGLALTGCSGADDSATPATATPTPWAVATTAAGPGAAESRVASVVTADGALEAQVPPQVLSFGGRGEVLEVMVAPGDPVALGDLLARIDGTELERAIVDADTAIVNAREGLAAAELALARTERGTDLETARLEVERAKNNRWSQQVQRDGICGRAGTVFTPQSDCDAAQASVQAAEQTVEIAEANYRGLQEGREDELAAARARVSTARASAAQAVDARERAVTARAGASIVAPFEGVVEQVHVTPGVEMSPGAPAITLAKTRPLDFVTSNLGERYVGDVQEGAAAEVWLTPWQDQPLSGTVRRVAASGAAGESGAVVYRVWIALEPTSLPIRAGMTGRVEIAVEG